MSSVPAGEGLTGAGGVASGMRYVLPLGLCTDDRSELVGGKASGLQSLIEQGLPVPDGFVVTTDAYREFIATAGLAGRIGELLGGTGTPAANERASRSIAALFEHLVLLADLTAEIASAYHEIGMGPVAVRSSAIAEDREDASFAGQQETYLWIDGIAELARHVLRCWASLFTPQAIGYRSRFDVKPDDVAMAVVIQRMVPAVAAGVLMTLDPVSGDRSRIYIESAHGLGEGVVRGDVEADRFWLKKDGLELDRSEIGLQTHAYTVDVERSLVLKLPLDAEIGQRPSLDAPRLRRLGELAISIEGAHGRAMDIEWAIAPSGEVVLLQARPETVWSNRDPAAAPGGGHDTLHGRTRPGTWWTTTNVGEAIPFPSPLCWSIWGTAGETGLRRCFRDIGALSVAETIRPRAPEDQLFGIFFGRPAFNLDLICSWGDRLPGSSGAAMAEQICGFVPEGFTSNPSYRHYPRGIARMSTPLFRARKLALRTRADASEFWTASVPRLDSLDENDARTLLLQANDLFTRCAYSACVTLFGAVQPAYVLLGKLAVHAGVDAQPLMSGLGNHAESAVINDMWACSRDQITLEEFLARYGYHGPNEGETSSRVWREDPAPAHRLIERYRAAPDDDAPVRAERLRVIRHREVEEALIAATPRSQRRAARFALGFISRSMPLRSVSKVAAIQANDIVRGAARRLGDHLAERGILASHDDVFYLTIEEIRASTDADLRPVVADRRAHRVAYAQLDIPTIWQGEPRPGTVQIDPNAELVEGIGASAGVVDARVRVVTDPSDAEIESGEILVARDTDQGWASLMYLSAGLVADIGGVMSHTAVVARELEIPCVVGTKVATRTLKTGDRVRMDGTRGTVEILQRADSPAPAGYTA
jgi:pyruvate,water dikinase